MCKSRKPGWQRSLVELNLGDRVPPSGIKRLITNSATKGPVRANHLAGWAVSQSIFDRLRF
jgi:hypothetical protein